MKRLKKEKKRKDRISQLPDEILVNILGFLSVKDAVGTSVLSKRWKNVWKHVVRLDFDASKTLDRLAIKGSSKEHNVRIGIFRKKARRKYVQQVDNVLALHKAKVLHTFRICFDLEAKFKYKIDDWLERAFAKRVERLELNLLKNGKPSEVYEFTNELLGKIIGKSSESSSASGSGIRSRGFKHVRALTFRCANVSNEVLGFFLQSCPFLEHLAVDGSRKLKNELVFADPSLALKYLEIWNCFDLNSITVRDVNIVSIKVSDLQKLVLENVPMLVDVWVSALPRNHTPLLDKLVNGSWLSPCIPQLQILTLQATCKDVKREKANTVVLPELFNLKQLTLVTEGVKDDSLIPFTALIRASPNLEKFVLKLAWNSRFAKVNPYMRGSNKSTSRESEKGTTLPLKHLKVVELLGYHGRTTEVELLEYFLENAVALKSIIIDPHDHPISAGCRRRQCKDEEELAREHAENKLKPLIPPQVELVIL